MNIVVDTNILITFFWKENVFEKMIKKYKINCYSPEFALEEINKYQSIIIKKANISKKEFEDKRLELAIYVNFVSLEEYQSHFKQAIKISPDKNDVDFFALSLKIVSPVWSNDKELKNQTKIPVFSTGEILENPHILFN
ncbi:MAG: PIN domain-containing protein [Candidatus Woesearchaeota archaeon]